MRQGEIRLHRGPRTYEEVRTLIRAHPDGALGLLCPKGGFQSRHEMQMAVSEYGAHAAKPCTCSKATNTKLSRARKELQKGTGDSSLTHYKFICSADPECCFNVEYTHDVKKGVGTWLGLREKFNEHTCQWDPSVQALHLKLNKLNKGWDMLNKQHIRAMHLQNTQPNAATALPPPAPPAAYSPLCKK